MKIRIAVLCLCVLASPATASADETLDLVTFLSRVREDGVESLALRAPIATADTQRAVAGLRPAPGLELGLAQLDVSGQGAPTSSIVGVAIPIELGGDRGARLDSATAGRELVAADASRDIAHLTREAALAFIDAVEADELVAVRRSSLEAVARLMALDESRLQRGEITEVDFLRGAVEHDRLAAELAHAEGLSRARREALRRYLPTDAEPIAPTLVVLHDEPTGTEAEWIARALESRPEMTVLASRVAVARAGREQVRAARVPDAYLRLAWTHNGRTDEAQFRQHWNDVVAVTLGMPMPFANRRRADLGHADAVIAEAETVAEAMETRIAAEVRAAYAEHVGAHDRHAAFEGGVADRAARLAERTQHAYERDAATVLELLASRRAADEVEASRVAARAEHARTRVRLQAATLGLVTGW